MNSSRHQVYKCRHSGLTVEILTADEGCTKLECCGEEMEHLTEKNADTGQEKHVPILSGDENGVKVVVSSVPHPMTEEHHIVWIEVQNGPWVNRKYLDPTGKPEAEFYVPQQPELVVRSYCNLHGLWKG